MDFSPAGVATREPNLARAELARARAAQRARAGEQTSPLGAPLGLSVSVASSPATARLYLNPSSGLRSPAQQSQPLQLPRSDQSLALAGVARARAACASRRAAMAGISTPGLTSPRTPTGQPDGILRARAAAAKSRAHALLVAAGQYESQVYRNPGLGWGLTTAAASAQTGNVRDPCVCEACRAESAVSPWGTGRRTSTRALASRIEGSWARASDFSWVR